MNKSIEQLIKMKPHLKEPLRFYEKAKQFMERVKELSASSRPYLHAYPPELTGRIVQHLQSIFDLPEGGLSPLRQALELGEIDFTRLPLLEVPSFSLPYAEDELAMLLFLLSRPYFHALREHRSLDGVMWREGRCPVCSARPSLSALVPGERQLYCSFCGTAGPTAANGCPLCLSNDPSRSSVFSLEGEEGYKVQSCDVCRSYIKTVDAEMLTRMTPDSVDLMSMPLDIAIQEKGYQRRSPNPIGMMRMSTRG